VDNLMNDRSPHDGVREKTATKNSKDGNTRGWTAVNHKPVGKAIYWGVMITMAEKLSRLNDVWEMLCELNTHGMCILCFLYF